MANFSINDLTSVLEKSNLPFGDSASMQQSAAIGGRQAISGAAYGQDTQLAGLKSNYESQLAQIASMDQKLATSYGGQQSNLFIEHPLARERIIAGGPARTGYQETRRIAGKYRQRQGDIEDQIDEALKIYKELAKEQADSEKITKKVTKGTKAKGKGGGTISLGRLTKRERQAGFKDAKAAQYWTEVMPEKGKEFWVSDILQDAIRIPRDGFTIKDVNESKRFYEDKYLGAKERAKAKAKTTKPKTKSVFESL